MGRTCCVQTLFWMSETISVHNMFSPGLSLEFLCIELVVILWVSWCKNKSFWQRFTCTYLLYLLTYYYWKLKRKIDFVSWPAQHFLLVIKKLYFILFSPSYFVCSSEPMFDDESYLRRQNCNFLFLSSVCTGGRKAISKLMFPNSGCQFQWKTNLFLEKLCMVEAPRKSLKKLNFLIMLQSTMSWLVYRNVIKVTNTFQYKKNLNWHF